MECGKTLKLVLSLQRVVVDGLASQWAPVTTYGVPQGNILGPLALLFVIFINDVPEVITDGT